MASSENEKRAFMEQLVCERTIFIDTCSMAAEGAGKFWKNITPMLQQHQKRITIPLSIYDELQKLAGKNVANSPRARKSLKFVAEQYQLGQSRSGGVINIYGDASDGSHGDNVFLTVLNRFRPKYKLLLITNDKNLSIDALNLNKVRSVNGKNVCVCSVEKDGWLREASLSPSGDKLVNLPRNGQNSGQGQRTSGHPSFRVCTKVTSMREVPLNVSPIPSTGHLVRTSTGESLRLGEEIAAGGEGTVYHVRGRRDVAKIYNARCLTSRREEKLKRMLHVPVSCPGICYPTELLFNDRNQFVGYLMPKAKGCKLQSIFIKRKLEKQFPRWKKKDMVTLCITILEKLKYLHDRNIILGDINPNNILLESPTNVYFVDTDSYQIEDFPCPVGTVPFTPPELLGSPSFVKNGYASVLRTPANEAFAVATLLFMIMLPGKTPYAQQGGEDQATNIKKMDFSYPCGELSNKKAPIGPWRYIWSHLSRALKECFYNTFAQKGKFSSPKKRPTDSDWLEQFRDYYRALDRMAQNDAMSLEIFPTRYKKNPKETYERCKKCGMEVTKKSLRNGVCWACNQKSKTVVERKNCADCGKVFEVTLGEYESFQSKGLQLPKRCPSCRKKRKWQSTAGSGDSGDISSGSGCFSLLIAFAPLPLLLTWILFSIIIN